MKLSAIAITTLKNAASREHGNVCPCGRGGPASQSSLLDSLARKGLIDDSQGPIITAAGRRVVAHQADIDDWVADAYEEI